MKMNFLFAAVCTLVLLVLPHPHAVGGTGGPAPAPSGGSGKPQDIVISVNGIVTGLRCADMDGDGLLDLVVLTGTDPAKSSTRGVTIWSQKKDGTFHPLTLRAEWVRNAFLFDTGEFDGAPGKELLIVRKGSVSLAGIRKGTLKMLPGGCDVETLYHGSVHRKFVFLDSSFDLDGDGLDDPIIPSDEGYVTLLKGLQRKCSFSDPVAKRAKGVARVDNSLFVVTAEAGKLRVVSCRTGPPLVVGEEGGKIVARRFDSKKDGFVRMESGRGFGAYGDSVKVGTLEYTGTVVGDFFGRGNPDLLLSSRSGKVGILTNLKTVHTFYTMTPQAPENSVLLAPRQRIANAGICAMPTFSDLDGDGHDDLVLRFVEASMLAKFLETLLDRVVITCQAFRFQPEKGNFSFDPDWSREVPVPADCFETVGIEGLVRLDNDFTGDGRPDLVVYDSDRLLFYRGESSSGWFSSQEIDFKSRPFYQAAGPFPGPLLVADVDGDGKKEIITSGKNIVRVIHVN
jgi:hypothetical protein